MLARIFWHSRFEHVPEEEYISNLRVFHTRIGYATPDGFLGSRVLRYDAVPWLASATEVYEDWYLMRDSGALDRLDEAAIAAFAQQAHGVEPSDGSRPDSGVLRRELSESEVGDAFDHQPGGDGTDLHFDHEMIVPVTACPHAAPSCALPLSPYSPP